jgi:hypothetical protein
VESPLRGELRLNSDAEVRRVMSGLESSLTSVRHSLLGVRGSI